MSFHTRRHRRRALTDYAFELVIASIGVAISLGESLFTDRTEFSIMTGAIAVFVALALAGTRREIRHGVSFAFEEWQILNAIDD